jgi:hypothetical protein
MTNWLRWLLCTCHEEHRRWNRRGLWLSCPNCGWESEGWRLR